MEGDKCMDPSCNGHYEVVTPEDCSCHTSPPCSACIDRGILCDLCGQPPEEEN